MGYQHNFSEDSVIIKQGERNRKLYMVTEGHVVLYINYGEEDEYLLGLVGPNKVFGETAVLTNEPSAYTAVAFDDVTAVGFYEYDLESFCEGHPKLALGIVRSVARNNSMLKENCKMLMEDIEGLRDELDETNRKLVNLDRIKKEVVRTGIAGITYERVMKTM